MNTAIVRYVLGYVLRIESLLMTLPIVTALIYQESQGWAYVIVALVCFFLGTLLSLKKPKSSLFYLKEGCVTTALSWIVMSVFGCFPFMITKEIPSFFDAFFETVSGFTTTGSSILTDVEAVSHTSLIWRSFTHWTGGMGVLVFLLAIIPLTGGSNINLMKAESPGPSVGKLVPRIKSSAQILYLIYIGMTLLQIALLLCTKMPVFDTLCMTFGSAGTGGFGVRNSSAADYTALQQWIIGVFCMLFGVNFNFYYFLLHKQPKKSLAMEEVRWYFIIILFSTLTIFSRIISHVGNIERALRQAFFQVASIITTTGFSSVNFNKWDSVSKMILVTLMFIGACAGSTGGGLKVSRVVNLFKTFIKEIVSYIHPKSVKKIKMDGETVEHDVIRSTNVYFVTYFMIFVISLFIICFDGKDLITSFTAVAATFNNIGPGLGVVGPAGNFHSMSNLSKLVLSFDMLAGRLELFPMLILFTPEIWTETFIAKKKHREHRLQMAKKAMANCRQAHS
jgi:trk system potassium uptake protein TrkH